jgi:hypothetical protein
MFYLVIGTILLIGLLDTAARRSRINALQVQIRFQLFGFRDELRMKAIEGEIVQDNWFDYFDTTFTKMIEKVDELTIWKILLLLVHYHDDEGIARSTKELFAFLYADGNEFYLDLFGRYAHAMGTYLLHRHRIIGISTALAARVTNRILQIKNDASAVVATAPETSTFTRYCTQ